MGGLFAHGTYQHWRVSLVSWSGLPAIPSPTICAVLEGRGGLLQAALPLPEGLALRDRLRHALDGSPTFADRIEFTAAVLLDRLCYGLVLLVPLLSTPHCCDAVTVRYCTALHRTDADFHRIIPTPSQAH